MLEIVKEYGFLGEEFLARRRYRALGVEHLHVAQRGAVEIAAEGTEKLIAYGAQKVRLARAVRPAEYEQPRRFGRVPGRGASVRGPENGPADHVAGEAERPFVLPVADEGFKGPFLPEGRGVAHGGMDARGAFLGGGRHEKDGRRWRRFPGPVDDGQVAPPQRPGFLFKNPLKKAGEAQREKGVRKAHGERVGFLIKRQVEGIEPALQRGFAAQLQGFARGGKPFLRGRRAFGAFGRGEAGKQGRSGFGERFHRRREKAVA